MAKKVKDFDEQFIKEILYNLEEQNISEKEKLILLKKIISYLNRKMKYYKEIGIDASIGMFLVGTGIGSGMNNNESVYLSTTLCILGVSSMLIGAIRRNVKYKVKEKQN